MFQFQPRWKEELVVTGPGGMLVLEHPMGVPTVYLPTEREWQRRAPAWAGSMYPALKDELEAWCSHHGMRLVVEKSADVYGIIRPS